MQAMRQFTRSRVRKKYESKERKMSFLNCNSLYAAKSCGNDRFQLTAYPDLHCDQLYRVEWVGQTVMEDTGR